jgi:hypothetical protein
MVLVAVVSTSRGQYPNTLAEYSIKAAFLAHFLQYVEWPPGKLGPDTQSIVVGVLGPDPFGPELDTALAVRPVDGLPVTVVRLAKSEDAAQCHAVFVNISDPADLSDAMRRLCGQPVLTIGQRAGFLEAGGIINLYVQADHVRFEINPVASQTAGIRLRAQLLKLARIVPLETSCGGRHEEHR